MSAVSSSFISASPQCLTEGLSPPPGCFLFSPTPPVDLVLVVLHKAAAKCLDSHPAGGLGSGLMLGNLFTRLQREVKRGQRLCVCLDFFPKTSVP